MPGKIKQLSAYIVKTPMDQNVATNKNGATLDTLGYWGVCLALIATSGAAGVITATLNGSNDNFGTTAVVKDVNGNNVVVAIPQNQSAQLQAQVDIRLKSASNYRYYRWVYSAVANIVAVDAIADLFEGRQQAASTPTFVV